MKQGKKVGGGMGAMGGNPMMGGMMGQQNQQAQKDIFKPQK
jgi:hypothetical protein